MTLKQKDVAKLAKQFDQLSEIVLAIAGTFRSAGGAADDSGDDGEAGDEVRPSAGKSKSAASKPAAKKTAAKGKAAEVTEDDVREALQELAEAKGAGALVAALATVGLDGSLAQRRIDQLERRSRPGHQFKEIAIVLCKVINH